MIDRLRIHKLYYVITIKLHKKLNFEYLLKSNMIKISEIYFTKKYYEFED